MDYCSKKLIFKEGVAFLEVEKRWRRGGEIEINGRLVRS
jgi:hypothetical protein